MELHDLYVSAAWVNVVACVLVYVLSSPFQERATRTWSASLACSALGCFFLSYGEGSAGWFGGGLTSAAISGSSILRYVSINQLTEKKTSRAALLAAVILLILAVALTGIPDKPLAPVALGGALLNALLCPPSIRTLFGRTERPLTPSHWGLAAYLLLLTTLGINDVFLSITEIHAGLLSRPFGNQFPVFLVFLILVNGSSGVFLHLVLAKWMARFKTINSQLGDARMAAEKTAILSKFDRDATVNQMAGALVHEVSQPISALLAQAQFAQAAHEAGKLSGGEIPVHLEKIIASARRASALLTRFRSFSRGEVRPDLHPLSLGDSVAATLKLLAPQLALNNIRLEFSNSPGNDMVRADELMISQLIMNLVRNAETAMKAATQKNLSVKVYADATTATVDVRDTGTGLVSRADQQDPDEFQPGLGLRIVREIVSDLQGQFFLENRPTGGALARVTLPLVSGLNTAMIEVSPIVQRGK